MAVTCVADPAAALAAAGAADLILIDDAVAPGACATLRAAGVALPLVLLAPPGSADSDADLLLVKPLRLAGLGARLAELLARPVLGGWRLDPERRVLAAGPDRVVRLTDKEVAILLRLGRAAGAVVAREELLADVWGYSTEIDTHTLETHIYRLRRKLADEAAACLLTEPGGYRLV
ncbi:winged helix-turn-helix domain-containing protein [Phaeospirillum tilakii]|uniref:Winged helix-turn-helix domain-containing protein n=1 Tax=Phaeospirillum tilakii TaxID=741673 RepID=A0ABW5C8J0_9PROT